MTFKPYHCHGCGVTVTKEPWPHLDRALFAPPARGAWAGRGKLCGGPDCRETPQKHIHVALTCPLFNRGGARRNA